MKDNKTIHRKSEYRRAYRCISNQKRHDIWQENAEYRQERRRRDFGHESWSWDTNSSDDECTCGCGMSDALMSYRDFSKSMGDLRPEELGDREHNCDDRSSAGSSPKDPSSPRHSGHLNHNNRTGTLVQRFADKSVSTDGLASFVEKATQTEQSSTRACVSQVANNQANAGVREKKLIPKVRFTAPADQLRRNSTEAVKSRPNSAIYQSEYRSSFVPIRF